ncbi:MAG: non-heme iron oxygenase ferredoxin subunit [Candidatus Marinimicrobia bacterium]|nr:non-heme iron oxygenase ferredoxin subunit [Candidatus Neomarinimicrobiota bacterium]
MSRERVGGINEIPVGSMHSFEINGKKIAVCNVSGLFHAIEDVCTHDGAPLDQGTIEGNLITCPRHGAIFDVTTGEAVGMPAVIPVKTFEIEIEDDVIYIDIDE